MTATVASPDSKGTDLTSKFFYLLDVILDHKMSFVNADRFIAGTQECIKMHFAFVFVYCSNISRSDFFSHFGFHQITACIQLNCPKSRFRA